MPLPWVLAWSVVRGISKGSSEYMAAAASSSVRDWDSALHHTAGGYKDSPDRVSEATRHKAA